MIFLPHILLSFYEKNRRSQIILASYLFRNQILEELQAHIPTPKVYKETILRLTKLFMAEF